MTRAMTAEKQTGNQNQHPQAKPRGSKKLIVYSPKFIAAVIVFIIIVFIIYYALLDRYTPITSEGYIQANVTQIAPQVGGSVTAVHVKDNIQVKAGELLFELDARPYAYAVDQLEAELTLAHKEVALLEQDLDLANDMIDKERADLAYAQTEFGRYSSAARKGAAPMIQVDQARDRLSVGQALLQRSLANKAKAEESLNAKIGDINALIAKAEANLKKAKYDLEQTKVYAPTDGYVTNLQLTPGTYVHAGAAVMTFVDGQDWRIVANFRENSLQLMKPGLRAKVTMAMYPGRIFEAVVESVGWGVGEGQGIPSGILPDIRSPTNWVKLARRFPVRIRLQDSDADIDMRVGGSITVVVFPTENFVLNALARLWLNIASLLNYVY
jgi:multidrug resistance efflux pump